MKSTMWPIKLFLFSGVLLLLILLIVKGSTARPEPVHFVRETGVLDLDWYRQQARLWKEETQRHPQNPRAWYYYFLATHYSYFGVSDAREERKAKLEAILSEMQQHLPESFEYYFAKSFYDFEDLASLKKAYRLQPENPATYYNLITHYELENDRENFQRFNRLLYDSENIYTGLIDYNYNMLNSTSENAILFTNGDNDTYPAWMLQQVKDIRPDITILNIHLIKEHADYLKRKLADKNITIDMKQLPDPMGGNFIAELCQALYRQRPDLAIHFAVTVNAKEIEPLSDDLYAAGLTYHYSPVRFDNVAELQKNMEYRLRLDYLDHDWYHESHVSSEMVRNQLNTNYIAPSIILFEYYDRNNQAERAAYWKDLAFRIARQAGKEEQLNHYFEKKQ